MGENYSSLTGAEEEQKTSNCPKRSIGVLTLNALGNKNALACSHTCKARKDNSCTLGSTQDDSTEAFN